MRVEVKVMNEGRIKQKPTVGAAGGRMGSLDFDSLAVPILAYKSIERKVEVLEGVQIQALFLALSHENPHVRRKHWAIYATCQRRITRLCLRLENGE